jgi:hypothetical protein
MALDAVLRKELGGGAGAGGWIDGKGRGQTGEEKDKHQKQTDSQ